MPGPSAGNSMVGSTEGWEHRGRRMKTRHEVVNKLVQGHTAGR